MRMPKQVSISWRYGPGWPEKYIQGIRWPYRVFAVVGPLLGCYRKGGYESNVLGFALSG